MPITIGKWTIYNTERLAKLSTPIEAPIEGSVKHPSFQTCNTNLYFNFEGVTYHIAGNNTTRDNKLVTTMALKKYETTSVPLKVNNNLSAPAGSNYYGNRDEQRNTPRRSHYNNRTNHSW